MENQHQNPEFSDNPENFHPCILCARVCQNYLNIVVMAELILTRLTEE